MMPMMMPNMLMPQEGRKGKGAGKKGTKGKSGNGKGKGDAMGMGCMPCGTYAQKTRRLPKVLLVADAIRGTTPSGGAHISITNALLA